MAIGSEAVLLVALALVGGLLVWERWSGNRERGRQNLEYETRLRVLMATQEEREADLLDRLTKALGKVPPPRTERDRYGRYLFAVPEAEPRMPVVPVPVTPEPPTPEDNGVYPSMGLNDDQQELVQRMAAQGKDPQDIWRALMQAQTQ